MSVNRLHIRTALNRTTPLSSTPITIFTVPNDGNFHTYAIIGGAVANVDATLTHGEQVAILLTWTDRYGARPTSFNVGPGESRSLVECVDLAPNTPIQLQGQGGANFPQGWTGYINLEEMV